MAVIGGVLALVGNVLHPRWSDIDDVELYTKIADSGIWNADHLILVVALIFTTAGIVAVARSLEDGEGDTLARYGLLATVVGGAIAIGNISIDGYAMRAAAENFADAIPQDRNAAFWAVNAIDNVSSAMFSVWTLVLLGVSPFLLGLAAIRSGRIASWLGGAAVLGGVVSAGVGLAGLADVDGDSLLIPFLVGSLLVTVWVLGAGWTVWQRASAEDRVAA